MSGKFEIVHKGKTRAPDAAEEARAEALLEAIEAAQDRTEQSLDLERGATARLVSLEESLASIRATVRDIENGIAALNAAPAASQAKLDRETADLAEAITLRGQILAQRDAAQAALDEVYAANETAPVALDQARQAFAAAGFRLTRDDVQSAARIAANARAAARRAPASSATQRPSLPRRTAGGLIDIPRRPPPSDDDDG